MLVLKYYVTGPSTQLLGLPDKQTTGYPGGPRRRFRSGGTAYDGRLCLLGEAMLEEDTTERLVEEPCNPPPGGGLMIVVCRLCILLVAGAYKK